MLCGSCARICHKGHILHKAVVGSPASFSCFCESRPSACQARNVDKQPSPKVLMRLHEPMLLGEFLRKVTESERLRLAYLRCLILWVSGRAELTDHGKQVQGGLQILWSALAAGFAHREVASSASQKRIAGAFAVPTIVREILSFL